MSRHKLAAISNVVSLQIPQLLKTTSTSDKIYLAYAGKRLSQERLGLLYLTGRCCQIKIHLNATTYSELLFKFNNKVIQIHQQ